jgi:hypothetical protein
VEGVIWRHRISSAMLEVMGMVQAGDDGQGVVVAPGVCGYVAGSGCAGVAAPWICVSPVVAVPVLRRRCRALVGLL